MTNGYDLLGIGIGPSNLGLAAMAQKLRGTLDTIFFDRDKKFEWHPDMMLKDSILQVHYLKDLVTPIDPTSPYSFISYLVENSRFYQFINRKTSLVPRKEFDLYYQWVSSKLDNLSFSSNVECVTFDNEHFRVVKNGLEYRAKNISCGVGHTPNIPIIFKDLLCDNFFHSIEFLSRIKNTEVSNKSVAIVGGGQSGAELFYHFISQDKIPEKLYWISKRINFHPVEDACFNRDIFTPFHNKYFNSLPNKSKEFLLNELHLSGDGIDPDLIDNIYRKLYEIKYLIPIDTEIHLLPAHHVIGAKKRENAFVLSAKNILNDHVENIVSDIVISATGFKFKVPECLKELLNDEDMFRISEDFSISMNDHNKIYIQNGARATHGLSDPYLSTSAWRNATIINSVLKKEFYKIGLNTSILTWKQINDPVRCLGASAPAQDTVYNISTALA